MYSISLINTICNISVSFWAYFLDTICNDWFVWPIFMHYTPNECQYLEHFPLTLPFCSWITWANQRVSCDLPWRGWKVYSSKVNGFNNIVYLRGPKIAYMGILKYRVNPHDVVPAYSNSPLKRLPDIFWETQSASHTHCNRLHFWKVVLILSSLPTNVFMDDISCKVPHT